MNLATLPLYKQRELLLSKQISPSDLVQAYIANYQAHNTEWNIYLELFNDALDAAKTIDDIALQQHLLAGIPGALKDNIAVKGRRMSCASHILDGYVSPYNATVIDRLEQAHFINMGRLNHDEMAMGATGRYSAFGPTLNPLDTQRLVGGSSSGSAAAVAAGMASFTLGSDTGGSCRLPASYAGIYGFKPTYGAIPRYGLAEYAPSLDTVGILARSPLDIAYVYHTIAGAAAQDDSSVSLSTDGIHPYQPADLKGMKIAVFSRLLERCHESVQQAFAKAQAWLIAQGAQMQEVVLGIEDHLLSAYYITACSEAASSLSRYDGARYGLKVDNVTDTDQMFCQTRTQGFGHEVQRRILLGNYFLQEANYHAYYDRSRMLRRQLRDSSQKLADDGIQLYLLPGFGEAPIIGASEEDSYASDLVGVFANLVGVPALAMPLYKGANGLPVSFQLSGPHGSDALVLRVGEMMARDLV
jgi:aspartyl-tRNA(Asn)/glutamyl-tRNA(Gln) amidotransferase subunit A